MIITYCLNKISSRGGFAFGGRVESFSLEDEKKRKKKKN